jgi:hypothetical protein
LSRNEYPLSEYRCANFISRGARATAAQLLF